MSSQGSSITVVAVPPVAERIRTVKRESWRDLAGVAAGVGIGALLWFALLSIVRIPF
jgi:hypothetical protein